MISLPTNTIPFSLTSSDIDVISQEVAEMLHYNALDPKTMAARLLGKFKDKIPEIGIRMCKIAIEDSAHLFSSQFFAKHGMKAPFQAKMELEKHYCEYMRERFSHQPDCWKRYEAIEKLVGNYGELFSEHCFAFHLNNPSLEPVSKTQFVICNYLEGGTCIVTVEHDPKMSEMELTEKVSALAGQPVTIRTSTFSMEEIRGIVGDHVTEEAGQVFSVNQQLNMGL